MTGRMVADIATVRTRHRRPNGSQQGAAFIMRTARQRVRRVPLPSNVGIQDTPRTSIGTATVLGVNSVIGRDVVER